MTLMKIATWNINGIKARLANVVAWAEQNVPDIACLQEIKSVDGNFPAQAFDDLGYHVATHGQKSFNGVALLSKLPFDEITRGLAGDEQDVQARYIEAVFSIESGALRVASLYLPNGNPVDSDKYPYKLAWMKRLHAHARDLLAFEEPLVLAGDFNIIPGPHDVHDAQSWAEDALYRLQSRAAFRKILHLGLTDAFSAADGRDHQYTFWDFQGGAWAKNLGIRIDHLLLSPQAADRLQSCTIHRHTRGWEKPSDHVPVMIELNV